ncbi:MAG: hypothetical protein A2W25_12255 [candidate division Zixibacteria bacterium RBG_16_53_22]|nr:MAG: hypothetical protein A2W25_12255 [candidate division Zixibacteria bacterium RBG_16_53_22]
MDWYVEMRERVTKDNALDLTIEKFEKVLADQIELHIAPHECPLCQVWYKPGFDGKETSCPQCPLTAVNENCLDDHGIYDQLENLFHNYPQADIDQFIRAWVLPGLRKLKED